MYYGAVGFSRPFKSELEERVSRRPLMGQMRHVWRRRLSLLTYSGFNACLLFPLLDQFVPSTPVSVLLRTGLVVRRKSLKVVGLESRTLSIRVLGNG